MPPDLSSLDNQYFPHITCTSHLVPVPAAALTSLLARESEGRPIGSGEYQLFTLYSIAEPIGEKDIPVAKSTDGPIGKNLCQLCLPLNPQLELQDT
jgi:hypothetical protein